LRAHPEIRRKPDPQICSDRSRLFLRLSAPLAFRGSSTRSRADFHQSCQPAVTPTNLRSPAKALPALFHAGPRRLRSPLPSAQHFRRNGRIMPDVCSSDDPAEALPEPSFEASVKRHRRFERRQLRILLSKPQRSPNATLADVSDESPCGSSSENVRRQPVFSRVPFRAPDPKSNGDWLRISEPSCEVSATTCPRPVPHPISPFGDTR